MSSFYLKEDEEEVNKVKEKKNEKKGIVNKNEIQYLIQFELFIYCHFYFNQVDEPVMRGVSMIEEDYLKGKQFSQTHMLNTL